MTNINQTHQILESIESLDQVQTEQVLEYIKALANTPGNEAAYQKFKREAMKEIRQALRNNRKLTPSF